MTDTLRTNKEPIVIYSSGTNNLMREIANNPFGILEDYKLRDQKPNYDYTIAKSKDPKVLTVVMDGVERNFDHLLSINAHADIYSLGAYVPKSLQQEGMEVFRELIERYNEGMDNLCKLYHVTYINTNLIGKKFNNTNLNFHISKAGHHALANYILNSIYDKKILHPSSCITTSCEETGMGGGAKRMVNYLLQDYHNSLERASNMSGYMQQVEQNIAKEHLSEAKVFQKVNNKLL